MTNTMSATGERRRHPRTNQMLAARVCVEIDETIAHGEAIQVFADGSHVTLRGKVPREELAEVMSAACSVRGVSAVSNQLEAR